MKRPGQLICALVLSGMFAAAVPAFAAETDVDDVGRYQLFIGEYNIRLPNGENLERNLFRIDTLTGDVWIGKQTQYTDKQTGKQVLQRYWEPFEQYVTEPILTVPPPAKQ